MAVSRRILIDINAIAGYTPLLPDSYFIYLHTIVAEDTHYIHTIEVGYRELLHSRSTFYFPACKIIQRHFIGNIAQIQHIACHIHTAVTSAHAVYCRHIVYLESRR